MGGGFGSKFGSGIEGGLGARLSKAAGAPVKIMLTRFDQALAVGNRPSSFQKIKLGAAADGTLQAFDFENYGTAGIGAGGSTAGGGSGVELHAPYIYRVPNIRVKQSAVAVDAGSARAFRAPASPLSSYGMEAIMDELAVRLNMDPVELCIKNDPSEMRQKQYCLGTERFGWKEKYHKPGTSPGVVKTGLGCGGASWGGGGNRRARAEAQVNPDGSVEVRCGTQDLGTGTRTLPMTPARGLAALGKAGGAALKPFAYATALTPASARELAADNGRYLGGGIDLLGEMKEYIAEPKVLVNVKALPGLNKIEPGDKVWTIGANVTMAEVEDHNGLAARRGLPALPCCRA
jgi:hypothetical protein